MQLAAAAQKVPLAQLASYELTAFIGLLTATCWVQNSNTHAADAADNNAEAALKKREREREREKW